jgi:flagellar hook assembly protein FlgD
LRQQNYPNPFNPTTAISYTIPRRMRVRIDLFDATGRSIATLVDAEQDAGDHVARWDGRDNEGQAAASGVYFCRVTAEELSASIKLVLLR